MVRLSLKHARARASNTVFARATFARFSSFSTPPDIEGRSQTGYATDLFSTTASNPRPSSPPSGPRKYAAKAALLMGQSC